MTTIQTEKTLLIVSRHDSGLDPYVLRLSSPEYRETLYRLAYMFETTETNIESQLESGNIVETASNFYRYYHQPIL